MTVIRIFEAVVVVAAIVTIAVVLALWTPAAEEDSDDTDAGEDGWPRVPDEQMRIIDAALPKAQAWGRWVQYREAERQ